MWLLLSPAVALLLSGVAAASFVLSLYVWRASLSANRDDPAVIKQRCASTLTLCALAVVALWGMQWTPPQDSKLGVSRSNIIISTHSIAAAAVHTSARSTSKDVR